MMRIFKPTFSKLLPAIALTAAMLSSGQLMRAQTASDNSQSSPIAQQQQPQQALPPDDLDVHKKTFTGVIVKSGDKLVLTDTISKTIYQLDDQQKARDFQNKNVRVTGVFNPSTGTIHVTAIDPV